MLTRTLRAEKVVIFPHGAAGVATEAGSVWTSDVADVAKDLGAK